MTNSTRKRKKDSVKSLTTFMKDGKLQHMLEPAPGHVNRFCFLALFLLCCLIRTSLSRTLVVCSLLIVTFVYVEVGMCHTHVEVGMCHTHVEAGEQLAGIDFLLQPMGPGIELRSTGSAASALSH